MCDILMSGSEAVCVGCMCVCVLQYTVCVCVLDVLYVCVMYSIRECVCVCVCWTQDMRGRCLEQAECLTLAFSYHFHIPQRTLSAGSSSCSYFLVGLLGNSLRVSV